MDDGTEVLDLTAGLAVLNVGHNHPRIMAARQKWSEQNRLDIWKFIPSPYQAGLAHNLAQLMPGDLNKVFFCNSGAEANEGALKMAQKYAGADRKKTVYTDISFHGKTHATLAVSGSEKESNQHFKMLDDCLEIPYGDAAALEAMVKQHKSRFGKTEIGTFIIEAIRSEGVVFPEVGYFQKVRAICDKYDIVLIVDEVFCGFGRTGKMFAFQHQNAQPDIVSFSKAFGAGKASFGGYIARDKIFNKAYGKLKHATLHSTTYNGFGEEIITAIESINIIREEKLVENSEQLGAYFLNELRAVQSRHPGIVKDVRGVGLLLNIELENLTAKIAKAIPLPVPEEVIAKVTTGGVITELYEKHNVLVYTPLHDNNLIMVTPSLTITKAQIDQFIIALDSVLTTNLVEKGMKYLKRMLA
jgi:putrescine aminotransferase